MRFRTGAPGPTTPSRFLEELPDEVLPDFVIGEELEEVGSTSYRAAGAFQSKAAKAEPEQELEDSEDDALAVGDLVAHPVFGDGCITRIQGKGVNARVVVQFDETGEERTLLLAYSMLEKLA